MIMKYKKISHFARKGYGRSARHHTACGHMAQNSGPRAYDRTVAYADPRNNGGSGSHKNTAAQPHPAAQRDAGRHMAMFAHHAIMVDNRTVINDGIHPHSDRRRHHSACKHLHAIRQHGILRYDGRRMTHRRKTPAPGCQTGMDMCPHIAAAHIPDAVQQCDVAAIAKTAQLRGRFHFQTAENRSGTCRIIVRAEKHTPAAGTRRIKQHFAVAARTEKNK
jgi:hypothetical protein